MSTRLDIPTVSCWPNCAKCNKPVEMISQSRDRIAGVTTICLLCHGEIQWFDIRDVELISANSIEIIDAFAKRNSVTTCAPLLPSIPG